MLGQAVQLSLYSRGVFVASLLLVQLKGFSPHRAGLLVLVESVMGMAEPIEDVGTVVGVTEVAEHGERVVVVADGLLVVAGVVVDVAQGVQGGRFARWVVLALGQGECGLAVGAGAVVVAEAGGALAHQVERGGFPRRVVEGAMQVQGLGGVLQRAHAIVS